LSRRDTDTNVTDRRLSSMNDLEDRYKVTEGHVVW